MKHELQSAANFIAHLLRLNKKKISEPQLIRFRDSLIECFRLRYRDHWYPEKPEKGSGYRTIRINPKIDPLILQAGKMSKLKEKTLLERLPNSLTIWIDPQEVCYRFGEDAPICVLYNKSDTEPWKHNTLINKEYQKNKKKRIKDKLNNEPVEYKLKTKRSVSIEQLLAYTSL
jgi:protein Tob/BTG